MGETSLSNELSPELKKQIFAQESNDPFLILVTLSTDSFIARLVNNTKDIVSRGSTYTAYPFKLTLPVDDGQSARAFQIQLDNASLALIQGLRTVTQNIGVTIEMILASIPDEVQMQFTDLTLSTISYDAKKISATIIMDNFLTVEMTSERYTPSLYPGLF